MQHLATRFLSDSDREKVKEAVGLAEKSTAGEIVPLVVSASYHYPMANVTGAVTLALPLALLLSSPIGGMLWIGRQNMWVFLGLFAALFWMFHEIIKRVPWLKRIFISDKEIEAEVREAAVTTFFEEGLYRTRDETGVLIFISVLEHKVWVLADRGINAKVPQSRWDDVVGGIVDGIKEERQGAAVCEAVMEVGRILSEHFPIKTDDANELKDLIVKGD